MDADCKVMMVFVAFAVVWGAICGLANLEAALSFLLALLFFYVSYRMVPEVLHLEETTFEVGAWNIIKTGIIPYWFLWLVVWTLVYTLSF